MIVEPNCHAGVGDRIPGPWITDSPMSAYLRRADAAAITRTVLFAPLSQDYSVGHRQVAQIVRQSQRGFLGFVFLHLVVGHGRVATAVATAVGQWGFRGIKVHWRDGQMSREIAESAQARRMPVVHDRGGDTDTVEAMARAYPDLAWILPHLASFADDCKSQVTFVELLCRLPNVFTDNSDVRYFDILADTLQRVGAATVLFAGDGPFLHPGAELAKVYALKLGSQERSLVLGRNLQCLVSRVRCVSVPRRTRHERPPGRSSVTQRRGVPEAGVTPIVPIVR